MLTTLTVNSFIWTWLLLGPWTSAMAFGSLPQSADSKLSNSTFCISHSQEKNKQAECTRTIQASQVAAELATLLIRADEVDTILSLSSEKPEQMILLTRTASNRANPLGYCGAGYEDVLLLISHDGNKYSLHDQFLLQSCLQSITLQSDYPDEVVRSITVNAKQKVIELQWLSKPDDKKHLLSVINKKFVLQDVQ